MQRCLPLHNQRCLPLYTHINIHSAVSTAYTHTLSGVYRFTRTQLVFVRADCLQPFRPELGTAASPQDWHDGGGGASPYQRLQELARVHGKSAKLRQGLAKRADAAPGDDAHLAWRPHLSHSTSQCGDQLRKLCRIRSQHVA